MCGYQHYREKIRKDSELFKLLGIPPPTKPLEKTNQQVLDEINNIFYKFLWDGKGDKIKRSIMISDYENGGLGCLI